MNHDKIIESFTSTEGCCKMQHCVHKKGIVCDDDNSDFNTRFCLNCISGIFHSSLKEIEQKRQEKRGQISKGHQFLATGFADGTLFQYECVNTGETFFYRQEPSNDAVVQETGLKWLKAQQNWSGFNTNCVPKPLCAKGDEFKGTKQTLKDPKQKTLDDYVTQSK
jgi:hypothetical protein